MKTPKAILHQMAVDAWGAGVAAFVLCLALEVAERGFVSRFFNLLWLLLFIVAASVVVMATQSRLTVAPASHHPAKGAQILLQFGSLLVALAAWFLLPESLKPFWRAAAAGGILLAVLVAWPIFSKYE